ncbi:GntR family transcriptional regulator [Brevundimonas sp.]|uniref:GntR family transcriptional regulator n=1 Tax=Brevundimonas sp. TaxID=1871086 RepID=UPI003BAC105B
MTNIESSLSASAVVDLQDREGSLVGKIANEIASGIVNGDLKPGDDLNSVELATRFGTSRTPVREALMLLEKEGLVEIPPRRRPRVAHVTFQEIEELYQIRALLNGMMIELFVTHADEAGLAEAHAVLERMQAAAAADETDLFIEERVQLHAVWADRCGNQTLKKTLAAWRARISLRRLGIRRPEQIERSLLDHRRLVMACDDRDSNLARELIRSMTLSGLDAIRETRWSDQLPR